MATPVLTTPREKRIGIQPAWERDGNSLGATAADEQRLFLRGVAQFGRALALGASGRRFKSFHPDLHTYYNYALLFCGILARELGNSYGQSGEWRDNRCRE